MSLFRFPVTTALRPTPRVTYTVSWLDRGVGRMCYEGFHDRRTAAQFASTLIEYPQYGLIQLTPRERGQ